MEVERNRQDAEFRQRYNISTPPPVLVPTINKPLSRDALNNKLSEMEAERNRQDAEFRQRYAGLGVCR